MARRMLSGVVTLALLVSGMTCYAEEPKKIQDNSFLIEEAYNQEPGVIQHIQSFLYDWEHKTWDYAFVQEWPVPGRTHQFSYTIPVSRLDDPKKRVGLGDVLLNYRYQLIYKEKEGIALAPRFSLLLPTGDHKEGFGSGALGYQVNLPLSVELGEKWVTHWNTGLTYTPDHKEPGGSAADTLGFNYGASLIYLLSGNVNLMLEAAGSSNDIVQPKGVTTREDSFFINPGVRFAINFDSGLQIVPGIGFPIGVGPSEGEAGVFLYLSFEHPLF